MNIYEQLITRKSLIDGPRSVHRIFKWKKKKNTFPSHEVANGVRQSGGRLSFRDEVPTVGEWRILVLAH